VGLPLEDEKEATMSCIYLTCGQVKMCSAVDGNLVLSLDELSDYCLTDNYHTCKIYQRYLAKGMKIPLTEYQRGLIIPKL
jgi:hypothetical protein